MQQDLVKILKEVEKLISLNKLNDAKILVQPLILEYRNNHRVFSVLGNIYHKQGEFSRAIKNYKTALDINPRDVETAINLSLIYNDLGKYKEGAELYSNAVAVMKELEDTGLGIDVKEANSMFALQHSNIADLYLRYNRAEEALREIERAIALDPENYKFYVDMAEALSRLSQRELAIKKLKYVKVKQPKLYEARVKLGHLMFLSGEHGSAIEEWEAVLREDPSNLEARMYIKMVQDHSLVP